MSLLDDLKKKADHNGDGKLSKDDLESLRNEDNGNLIDNLKAKADQNGDGNLNWDDAKNSFGNLTDAKNKLGDLKDKFFNK